MSGRQEVCMSWCQFSRPLDILTPWPPDIITSLTQALLPDKNPRVNKEQVRKVMLEKRLSLSQEDVEEFSKIIQNHCLKSPMWPKTGRVGLYAPVKNEVMTQTIFQKALEAGLHVYFPRVEQGIRFYEVNGPDDLQRGSWSIPEPMKHCNVRKKDHHFDLLIVPGIAFTKDCYRIGYGRGFYDKFIAKLPDHFPFAVVVPWED